MKKGPLKGRQQLTAAKKLINQAQDVQIFPFDNRADVLYLRASNLLHAYLKTEKSKTRQAEAMYHLGQVYEALQDIGLWTMHETYYEACIHAVPHTPRAAQCFSRYELNVLMGFSGSGGTSIPDDVEEKLTKLRQLKAKQ